MAVEQGPGQWPAEVVGNGSRSYKKYLIREIEVRPHNLAVWLPVAG